MVRTIILSACLGLLLVATPGVSEAAEATETFGFLSATISGPDTALAGESVSVDVSGFLTIGGPLSWSAHLDADWAYDGNHGVDLSGGTVVGQSAGTVFNTFSHTLDLGALTPGEHTVTLVANRLFRVPAYSVAVDIVIVVSDPTVEVVVDIKPGSCTNPCSRKAKGMMPVAILGTADFDVSEIDPATVRLEGATAKRWSTDDVSGPGSDGGCPTGPDGRDDLKLMFDRACFADALASAERDDVIVCTLTGELYDGTAIEGADVILVK